MFFTFFALVKEHKFKIIEESAFSDVAKELINEPTIELAKIYEFDYG